MILPDNATPRPDGIFGKHNLDESEKQLDMARRLATACDARPLVAFCDTTLCGVHAQRCNQGRAQEFEAAATAIYRELGMQPLQLSPAG